MPRPNKPDHQVDIGIKGPHLGKRVVRSQRADNSDLNSLEGDGT